MTYSYILSFLWKTPSGTSPRHQALLHTQPRAVDGSVGRRGIRLCLLAGHEGEITGVYLGRLSAPRFSNGSLHDMEQDVHVTPPSQTTVPRLNNPEDAAIKTAYRGRLRYVLPSNFSTLPAQVIPSCCSMVPSFGSSVQRSIVSYCGEREREREREPSPRSLKSSLALVG
jgi:hypothetical protein